MSKTSNRIWQLEGDDTSALFYRGSDKEIPQLIWFGQRLHTAVDAASIATLIDLPLPMAKLDTPVALDIFPQASSGIDCHPALRGHRNGRQFNHKFQCSSVETCSTTEKKSDSRNNQLIVRLTDDITELKVTVTFSLESTSGVLGIHTNLENTGAATYQLEWLAAATVALHPSHSECLHLHGRWGLECQQYRQPIGPHRILLENNRGRTSHELHPSVITGETGFSENHGDAMAMHLAWSGSHRTVIEKLSDGRRYLQSGIALDVGELALAAGQSTQTPTVYITHSYAPGYCLDDGLDNTLQTSASGLNAISQRMHQFARTNLFPPFTRTPRPIHANSWEALYFDHDIATQAWVTGPWTKQFIPKDCTRWLTPCERQACNSAYGLNQRWLTLTATYIALILTGFATCNRIQLHWPETSWC